MPWRTTSRAAPKILTMTGCWINAAGFNIPGKDAGQYVTLLLDSDPTPEIEHLRVFFEGQGRQLMQGVDPASGFPVANEYRFLEAPGGSDSEFPSDQFDFRPTLLGGLGSPTSNSGDCPKPVTYQQWKFPSDADSPTKFSGVYTPVGPYLSQMIMTDFNESDVVRLTNGNYLLNVPAPVLPAWDPQGGQPPGDPGFLGNYRILLDYTGMYSIDTDSEDIPKPELIENYRMTTVRRARIPPVPNPYRWSHENKTNGDSPKVSGYDSIGTGNSLYRGAGNNDTRNLISIKGLGGSNNNRGLDAYGDDWIGDDVVPFKPSKISYIGYTGATSTTSEVHSWRTMNGPTHAIPYTLGHGQSIGVIFFSDDYEGPRPTGVIPDWEHETRLWVPDGDSFDTWSHRTNEKKVLYDKNVLGNGSNEFVKPRQLLMEAEITDRNGLNRVFYVPWIRKAGAPEDLLDGLTIRPQELQDRLGRSKLNLCPPTLPMFDPFSSGYSPTEFAHINSGTPQDLEPTYANTGFGVARLFRLPEQFATYNGITLDELHAYNPTETAETAGDGWDDPSQPLLPNIDLAISLPPNIPLISPPFMPQSDKFINESTRTFSMISVSKCCLGSRFSGANRPPGGALKYMRKLEARQVIPSRASLILRDPIRIIGNFVWSWSIDWIEGKTYEITRKPEVDSGSRNIDGYDVPLVAIGANINNGSAERLDDLTHAFQAGALENVEMKEEGGEITGNLPYLPGLEFDDPGETTPLDISIRGNRRHWGTAYVAKNLLDASSDPSDQLEFASIEPGSLQNRYGSKLKITAVLGNVARLYLVPSNVPDPPYEINLTSVRAFSQPNPGGVTAQLPARASSLVGGTDPAISDIVGMHDLVIASSLGTATKKEAVAIVSALGPEISEVSPTLGIQGSQIEVKSTMPGEITADNIWSVRLGTNVVFEEGVGNHGSIGIHPSDLVEGGKKVGIRFPAGRPGSQLQVGMTYDLKIKTLINSLDVPRTEDLVPLKTIESTYLNAFEVIVDPGVKPGKSESFTGPFREGTDKIFKGKSFTITNDTIPKDVPANAGFFPLVRRLNTQQEGGNDDAGGGLDQNFGYGILTINRNSLGLGKDVDPSQNPDTSTRYETESIQDAISKTTLRIDQAAQASSTINFNNSTKNGATGWKGPDDFPIMGVIEPSVMCVTTRSSRLSSIDPSQLGNPTPPFIMEDLLIIPDDKLDPENITSEHGRGGYYSYIVGFNFQTLPENHVVVIQNINSEEIGNKFSLQRLVDPITGQSEFEALDRLEIPPGYFAMHENGKLIAMNLVGVFDDYKLIREAIIYFTSDDDDALNDPTIVGSLDPLNGYGGEDVVEGTRSGHGLNFITNPMIEVSSKSIWTEMDFPSIPGRGRYILIIHDSLVDDYLYPGFVELKEANKLGLKSYAPSEVSLKTNIERTIKELPSIALPHIPKN